MDDGLHAGDENRAMKFTLLTHFKEFEKRSNTGRVVLDVLGEDAEQLCWDRMNPPASLLEEIERGGVALIYPGATDENDEGLAGITRCILIDGTWHEARKIHQRSPYLQKVRRVGLTPGGKSRYNLRKNQKDACLCTAECVIEVLRATGDHGAADRLEERFLAFIKQSGAKPAKARESASLPVLPLVRCNTKPTPLSPPLGPRGSLSGGKPFDVAQDRL